MQGKGVCDGQWKTKKEKTMDAFPEETGDDLNEETFGGGLDDGDDEDVFCECA